MGPREPSWDLQCSLPSFMGAQAFPGLVTVGAAGPADTEPVACEQLARPHMCSLSTYCVPAVCTALSPRANVL
jgi:hypothetical protein